MLMLYGWDFANYRALPDCAGVVTFQKKLRSQRLKRGIASRSVIIGNIITMMTNHRTIAAIHSDVDQMLRRTGGGGSGLTSWLELGVSGSGFGSILLFFGGTGGF
jgi:hypothetical protein